MITGLFTLQHRMTEKGARDWQKEREKMVSRCEVEFRATERLHSSPSSAQRRRDLDQPVHVVMKRIRWRETTKQEMDKVFYSRGE